MKCSAIDVVCEISISLKKVVNCIMKFVFMLYAKLSIVVILPFTLW